MNIKQVKTKLAKVDKKVDANKSLITVTRRVRR
jgi:hypothetical protein